jgi:hypothetical protein
MDAGQWVGVYAGRCLSEERREGGDGQNVKSQLRVMRWVFRVLERKGRVETGARSIVL